MLSLALLDSWVGATSSGDAHAWYLQHFCATQVSPMPKVLWYLQPVGAAGFLGGNHKFWRRTCVVFTTHLRAAPHFAHAQGASYLHTLWRFWTPGWAPQILAMHMCVFTTLLRSPNFAHAQSVSYLQHVGVAGFLGGHHKFWRRTCVILTTLLRSPHFAHAHGAWYLQHVGAAGSLDGHHKFWRRTCVVFTTLLRNPHFAHAQSV